jgi:hypothetical protein
MRAQEYKYYGASSEYGGNYVRRVEMSATRTTNTVLQKQKEYCIP